VPNAALRPGNHVGARLAPAALDHAHHHLAFPPLAVLRVGVPRRSVVAFLHAHAGLFGGFVGAGFFNFISEDGGAEARRGVVLDELPLFSIVEVLGCWG
jgi:hypothetical protein